MQDLNPNVYNCTYAKLHMTVSGRSLDDEHVCTVGNISLAVQKHLRDRRNIWDSLAWQCPNCNIRLTGEQVWR